MRRKIMDRLIAWKTQKLRMPLLLYGARQTGKTYILKEFAKENYEQCIYVNFEKEQQIREYLSTTMNVDEILTFLTKRFQLSLTKDTLIIYDEIQTCPEAITSLKYFCEDANHIHIVAAGSLLGVAMNRENISFPVGKVFLETLYPMDFEEFLMAHNDDQLIELIRTSFEKKSPLSDAWHQLALQRYREYLLIGGMPAVILMSLNNSGIRPELMQETIIDSYLADMAKYATVQDTIKIRKVYRSIPQQLSKENKKFQYKLVDKNATSSKFDDALEWLIESGIILKCEKVKNDFLPMKAYVDDAYFKTYLSDVGLLSNLYGLDMDSFSLDNTALFQGAVAENYVAQQLTAIGFPLYYFQSAGKAEIDFLIEVKHEVIPLEVKAGSNTKAKSLREYCQKYNPSMAVRISQKHIGFENQLLSLPLYALFCLDSLK